MNDDIKILAINTYRDGGTISIKTTIGEFCIDQRIMSKTKGQMYDGYPERSKLVDKETEEKILKLKEEFNKL
jgi:hypothetical protein